MKKLDRRQWLKHAGLTGSLAFMGGLPSIKASNVMQPSRLTGINEGPIRLSSNENPYGPSDKMREAIIEGFDVACRYPFAYIEQLKEAIAEKEGITRDHVVICGGSNEGLHIAGLTYGLFNGEIVAADPTFQSLLTYAEQFGAHVHRVALDDNLAHDLQAMEQRINANTRLVFVCNPNNPTGTILSAGDMENFCLNVSKKTMVFSDEAYYDYVEAPGYPSMVSLVKKDYNVIVSRTFSKVFGLAGLRVGYLIARPDIASRLDQNIAANTNILAVKAALAAMQDTRFYDMSLKNNREAKNYLYGLFDDMGLKYIRSHTNFVFFHTGIDIRELIQRMREKNVLIGRPFPPLTDWCRISTGTMDEMAAFGKALKAVV